MPNDSHRPDVAVFIDFENVYVSVRDKLDANPNFESIMERCEDFGRVVIARAYADWYRYPRVTSALYANGIEPMYVPTYYYDREMGRTGRPIKNSVDMNLCVEAMKTLYTNPNIAKFVLATGDRDFIPLVNTIRQQGKEVIVIGIGGAASSHLAQSADEFIFYETLVGKKVTAPNVDDVPRARMPEKGREYEPVEETPAPRRERERERERESSRSEAAQTNGATANGATANGATANDNGAASTPVPTTAPAEPTQPDVYDTLVKAINLARERGYVCSFGSLKLLMKELMGGDFKETRYKDAQGRPFAKFKDFVMEAERRGRVQVFTNGTVNEVFLPGEDPYKLSQFAAELKVEPEASPIALTEQPAEPSRETRLSSPANRRRRRRRPGRQNDQASDETTYEEFEGEETEVVALPELPELPQLMDEHDAAQVFEELLEQIENEDNESVELVDALPESILEPDTSDVAETELEVAAEVVSTPDAVRDDAAFVAALFPDDTVATSAGDVSTDVSAEAHPFDDADWQFLRMVVGEHGRPVSFAQLHDILRSARNRLNLPRTNEELRTLAKQAINNGALVRQGKGNRISYRLAELVEATDELESTPVEAAQDDQVLPAEPAETPSDEVAQEAETDQMSLIEQVQLDPSDEQQPQVDMVYDQQPQAETADDEQPQDEQPSFEQAVEQANESGSAVLDALDDAAALASDPVQAEAEVAEMRQEATGIALEPDSDIVGVAAVAPAEPAEAEAIQTPRTPRRRKAAQQSATSEETPTEAEAPRRTTRRRKNTGEQATEEAAPQRRTRRRKTEEQE